MYTFSFGNMRLPVTPQKLSIKIKGNNKTLTLANEGEMNVLRSPGLTEITFDAELPMLGQYHFADTYRRPDYYLDAFKRLMVERTPFQFIVSRVSPSGELLYDNDIRVGLENYTVTEDASKGLDPVVSITLKQCPEYKTKTITVLKDASGEVKSFTEQKQRDSSSASKEETYTVKSGDNLWLIAKKIYGDGSQYTKIYDANKDKIKNPNLIYAGQVLTLP